MPMPGLTRTPRSSFGRMMIFSPNAERAMKAATIHTLTRRHILTSTLACVVGKTQVRYREYAKCLPDYLTRLARGAYEMRNAEVARLTTREAILARQRWARETFWTIIGGQPERTPLNARVTGS